MSRGLAPLRGGLILPTLLACSAGAGTGEPAPVDAGEEDGASPGAPDVRAEQDRDAARGAREAGASGAGADAGRGDSGAAGGGDAARADASAAGIELRAMSFNVRTMNADRTTLNSWDAPGFRRDRVVQVIRDEKPDIFGVQEALRGQVDYVRAALPQYAVIARPDTGELASIFYLRDRFIVDDSGVIWLSETPDVPDSNRPRSDEWARMCTWGRFVERGSGRGFYLYNAHMDLRDPARALDIELIADRMAGRAHPNDPILFTGDFNSGEHSVVIEYVKGIVPRASEGTAPVPPSPRLVDTFRVLHPNAPGGTGNKGWDGDITNYKIDYVFAPRSSDVIEAQIVRTLYDGRYPSDHFPVTARVRLR
jgi:endonuclease/exonuclease/phosphatase family metal-dependent hydrolase